MLLSPRGCPYSIVLVMSHFPIIVTDFGILYGAVYLKLQLHSESIYVILSCCIFNCKSLYNTRDSVKVGRHECFGLYLRVHMSVTCMQVLCEC